MASLFRLAGLGTKNNSTRSEKTTSHYTSSSSSTAAPKPEQSNEKAIPMYKSRPLEHLHDDGSTLVQNNSGITLIKDPSMSFEVRLSQSRTRESLARDEERVDYNDRRSNRGRKPEPRDDGSLREDEVRNRSSSRRSVRTKKIRSGARSVTSKASRRRGRSLRKDQIRDPSRSKSIKTRSKSKMDARPKHENNNNSNRGERRTVSRRRGKLVPTGNKKKWNIAVGHGCLMSPFQRSLSADSLAKNSRAKKKKDRQLAARLASLTSKTSKEEYIAAQVTNDNTMDNHHGHDRTQDRYHPGRGYPTAEDDHSLVDVLNDVDDTYWDFTTIKRKHKYDDVETVEDTCSFDDSILYAYNDGWLASYDRCLGSVCGFEVDDDVPPSSDNRERRSKLEWIKNPPCTAIDPNCALADMKDDVVLEILGHTNEVKKPLSLDVDQK